jgi:hypothetical protein
MDVDDAVEEAVDDDDANGEDEEEEEDDEDDDDDDGAARLGFELELAAAVGVFRLDEPEEVSLNLIFIPASRWTRRKRKKTRWTSWVRRTRERVEWAGWATRRTISMGISTSILDEPDETYPWAGPAASPVNPGYLLPVASRSICLGSHGYVSSGSSRMYSEKTS